jgi:hypothetical protein
MPIMIWEWETEKGKIPINIRKRITDLEGIICVINYPPTLSGMVDILGLGGEIIECEDNSTIEVMYEEDD